jgi:peptidoglycan/LPS O-acetylase OafA/YrhL
MVMPPKFSHQDSSHIGFLDTLRGLLAFWVYYGHLKMAAIGKEVLIGSPAIAVDGFMLLSGFLMAYHWILRQSKFLTSWDQVKDFFLRRFFRIAPLYYSLLIVAFIGQDYFLEVRKSVDNIIPPAWGGTVLVPFNPDFPRLSIWNLLSRLSFTFGLIPKFVSSNILPDWSISLEMQFYLIFPLLVIILANLGPTTTAFFVFITTLAANKFFGLYDHAGLFARYPQPSMLLFKLNIFLAGMAIAYAFHSRDNWKKISWLIIGILSLYNVKVQVFIIAFIMVLLLFFDAEFQELFSRLGSWKISKFVGDTSYSLYLVHLLLIYPVLHSLFQRQWFLTLPIYPRLLVALGLITPVAYGLAYILYLIIERNGIRLGKWISRMTIKRQGGSSTV